jgi:tetratricopeptide (TPR) repeat protein
MADLPVLKIFLSSPGDVAEERALAEVVFRRLSDEFADAVRLSLVIWEHEPVFGHANFQHQIERPSHCDLVVSILWSRLGTRLPSDFAPPGGAVAPTGTEFELQDALASFATIGKPNLLIYRKIPGPQVGLGSHDFAERSEQYRRLDEFCRHAFYDAEGAVIVAHSSFTNSHDFERRLAEHVRRWLVREIHLANPDDVRPVWTGQSPFRGLRSFDAAHQAIFFGRSEAIGDLIRRIRETEVAASAGPVERMLFVQGMSGAGKTSLFKAGLLPFLELRPIEGIARWTTLLVRPSESDPTMPHLGGLGALASRLCEAVPAIERLGTSRQKLAQALLERPAEAAAMIEICVAADAAAAGMEAQHMRLLIYIDQLEEVFALPDSGSIEEPLLTSIVALAHLKFVWIMATIRSDFVHRLEAYSNLMMCLGHSPPYTLMPPRPDELADMIREPAKAAGLVWDQREGVSLDQELLRDASGNPESLPLLEYTLAELYERRAGRLLRWADYEGGLRGALISAADEVVTGASGDVDTAFRDVMRELVSVGEDGVATRRYASLARFADESAPRGLLDRLVARRLCVTNDEGHGEGPVAYLAHEALIRSWPRAQDWLQRETWLLRVRDEVAREARLWEFHKRADDWLGIAPEKLAGIRQIEDAGLMPSGGAAAYALRSRQRARRNGVIKQTAVAALVVLTIAAGTFWYFAVQQRNFATQQKDIATEQRNIAKDEAAVADRTTQFMVSLFKLADPGENRGSAVTVKEVLDKGANEIQAAGVANSLKGEPRIRAELLTAMGQAYAGLGLYKPAEKLLTQAREDQGSASVPDESRVRTLIASGSTQYVAGEYEPAEKLLREAVDLARKRLDSSNTLRSDALAGLAETLVQTGKYTEAEQICQEALVADRKRGPPGAAVTANTLTSLAKAYFYSGDLGSAEAPMRDALQLREQAFGMHHALTAQSLEDLGALLYQSGRYDEALVMYQQALPIFREVYGPEHPEMATILNDIGRSDLINGHLDEAEPLLRKSLAMTEKFEGDTHDDLVQPLNSLAMIDAYRERLEMARREIARADSIAHLPDHGEILDQVLLTEANIELMSGHVSRAGALLTESKVLLQKSHPLTLDDAWRYAVWDVVNARFLAASGNGAAAASSLDSAQPILIKRFGETGFYNLLAQRSAGFMTQRAKSKKD